jgi:predicted O-methyltransferase YrrM
MNFLSLTSRLRRRLIKTIEQKKQSSDDSMEPESLLAQTVEMIPILQKLAWAKPELRGYLQAHGVDVVPVSFYSSTPSVKEIEESFEYQHDQLPFLNAKVFDELFLKNYLTKLAEFAHEFDPPIEGNEETCQRYFWENSQFSHSDAMAYYCFIRKLQPQTILEIGAGFSTLVASEAIAKNGAGKIICAEPFPRPFLSAIPHAEVLSHKAQDLTVEWLNDLLKDGDLLFIDSTHTVKTGSDCLHLYLRLLPQIRRRIYVHAHDIFLPEGLPKEWLLNHQIFWTEQYLLLAFLLDNPFTKVLYGSAYHKKLNLPALQNFMLGRADAGGGSIYFSYDNH